MVGHLEYLTQEAEAKDLNTANNHLRIKDSKSEFTRETKTNTAVWPPCSLCGGYNHSPKHCCKGEHDINNIMEKMSINPHKQQQGTLYR